LNDTAAIDPGLASVPGRQPPRAGSLIVTVFGDSISELGNVVGLSSLIGILEPFGLNARQIRTAVFRLTRDNWLSCVKQGRKSYYSFTEFGQRQYERSAQRIYAARPAAWDGLWTLVLASFVEGSARDELRRELSWLGFGSIAPGVLAHPCADQASLAATLHELEVARDAVVMRARTEALRDGQAMNRLAAETWRLDEFAARYISFIENFRSALAAINNGGQGEPARLFELQTLLIHEYRRILLKLPDLPDELLPAEWPGRDAMQLTAAIYAQTHDQSAAYLEANLEGLNGPLRRLGAIAFPRFA